jgi:hypothetical protein
MQHGETSVRPRYVRELYERDEQFAEDVRQMALRAVRAAEYKLPKNLYPRRRYHANPISVWGTWENEKFGEELAESHQVWLKAINHARREMKLAAKRARNPTYCNQSRYGE